MEGYEMAVQRSLSRILEYIYCNMDSFPKSEATRIQMKNQIRLQKMLTYIYEHYMDDVTLQDIADAANISRSEAGRCFHAYMEARPWMRLSSTRLQTATDCCRKKHLPFRKSVLPAGLIP